MTDEINRIMVKQSVVNEYTVRLARDITEPDDFHDEFALFAGAGPSDVVKLQICSHGGSMDTCHMITKSMQECEAKVVGWIGPTCASAGGAIALACDEWEVDEMSSLMIHTGSFAPGWGKSQDVVAGVLHQDKMIARFVRMTYTGFLNEEELNEVIKGKELYFEGDELVERLQNFSDYRDAARQAAYEEMMGQTADPEAVDEEEQQE